MFTWLTRCVVLVLLCFGLLGPVSAAEGGLNQVVIVVQDRSPANFQKALAQGYAQMMKTLSGNPSIMTTPAVQAAASQAKNFVSSYSYQNRADPITSQKQLVLVLTFNQQALNKILQTSGQAVLGKTRPVTLVVLLKNQDGVLNFRATADAELDAIMLQEEGKKHGLPIIVPVDDLQDQALLTPNTVPSITENDSKAMRTRYRVSNMLIGVVTYLNDIVQVNWQFWCGDHYYEWMTSGATLTEATDRSFDRLLETISAQYGVLKSKKFRNDVAIEVAGIRGFEDYVAVMRSLKELTPVSHVALREMGSDKVSLYLAVNGGEEALQRSLQSAKSLVPAVPKEGSEQAGLSYEWHGQGESPLVAQRDTDNE